MSAVRSRDGSQPRLLGYSSDSMAFRKTAPPVAVAIALLSLLAVAGVPLLALLPAFFLIGFLGLGRDTGEAVLGRLCSRPERRPSRPPRSLGASRAGFNVLAPRGTALLACSRAVRPPARSLLSA